MSLRTEIKTEWFNESDAECVRDLGEGAPSKSVPVKYNGQERKSVLDEVT